MYIVVMEGLIFDWDPDKAHRNKSKHGVSFEEAETVSEDRFLLLGAQRAHAPGGRPSHLSRRGNGHTHHLGA